MSRSALKFTVSKEGRTTLVRLDGPHIVDQMYIARLGEELLAVLEEAQPPDLLIDLGEVETLSSSVLGKLIQVLKRARQLDGRVRLCSVQPYVRKIFRITQLDGVFDIHDTAEDALGKKRDSPPQSSDGAAEDSPPPHPLPV